MDEWSKQVLRSFGVIRQDSEAWLQQVSDRIADASEALLQATDELADQVQQALEPGLDRMVEDFNRTLEPLESVVGPQVDEVAEQINQVIDPILTAFVAGVGHWVETLSAPINSTVEPVLQNHPACVGCRNYCGHAYGGNMLVCAMHPFGPEGEQCEDWESFWPNSDNNNN
ncbi:MAG TPA: hypothetical protein V6D06_08340 [Trichocoleus sp.]